MKVLYQKKNEELKKVVLKVSLHDDKTKQKAMKTAAHLQGVQSVAMDMKDQKLTVTGFVDPVVIVRKLRKLCATEMVSVALAREEKKDFTQEVPEYVKAFNAYNPIVRTIKNPHTTTYYYVRSAEEDEGPKACVIC